MTALKNISLVIPAFNEQDRLPATLSRVLAWEGEKGRISEVVVVDDGSSDSSVSIAKATGDDRVRVIDYSPNAGKGYAIRRGVLEASHELILLCDADLSTPIEEADSLTTMIEDADLVIGSRAADVSRVLKHQPWYRQQMGKTFNRIMRLITGLPYSDTQCGFKLLRKETARAIFSEAVVDRFAFDVEMLMLAHKMGFRAREVPVNWINSPDSRVRVIRDSLKMLIDVIRIRIRLGSYS